MLPLFHHHHLPLFLFLFLFLLFFHLPSSHSLSSSSSSAAAAAAAAAVSDFFPPTRLLRPPLSGPQLYLDPTRPPLPIPSGAPSCSLPLLSHSFASTYGRPPVSLPYSPPPPSCAPPPWAAAVLSFSAASVGDQYDRIAAVWLGGSELLRTSTAEPTPSGAFWTVRKDVTKYSALLLRDGLNLSVMLENIVDAALTGVYRVNVSLDFFRHGPASPAPAAPPPAEDVTSAFERPADVIAPISEGSPDRGFWFRIEGNGTDARKTLAGIPPNTYRAALEIYASAHGDDEFWYSNPPDSYIAKNNLTTRRGNAAFREIVASVDGQFAGSVVPFPVIFAGGINPLFWAPVVGLGAFDLPSYTLDLTPFLSLLLDRNKSHEIGLAVTDGIGFWLVDANLHLWLDQHSDSVTAALTHYLAPNISISRRYSSPSLNGTFKIEASRKSRFAGWVNCSAGNLTAEVSQKLKFKSSVEFANDGQLKTVSMKAKQKAEVALRPEGAKAALFRSSFKTKYPISIATATVAGDDGTTYTASTNLSHTLYEETYKVFDKTVRSSALADRQDAAGRMVVRGHEVISGSAGTRQAYQYRDGSGVYKRVVVVADGVIQSDNTTASIYGLATS